LAESWINLSGLESEYDYIARTNTQLIDNIPVPVISLCHGFLLFTHSLAAA